MHVDSDNADQLFSRTFAVYLGSVSLLVGSVSLIAAYFAGSEVWDVRFGRLGDSDGPQLGLLIEGVRLFLVVVLGVSTVCLGFPEEVAALFRATYIRRSLQRFFARGSWRRSVDREMMFRLLFLLLAGSLAIWKVHEVLNRVETSPAATLLQWGVDPTQNIWTTASGVGAKPVIHPRALSYAELESQFNAIQRAYLLYVPYTLVNYALIIPLVLVVPLYSASCTDLGKLRMFGYARLLVRRASPDELKKELERIQARCFQASQRYLYLCAALGIVFVYVQFDPTLATATRTTLKYVFYVLVGGSALAVIRLWGHYYAAWQGALNRLVERGESTKGILDDLSPLKFGQSLLVQTPQGIVAVSLLTPTLQDLVSRILSASG